MASLAKKGPNADLAVPMARPENKVCADCGAKGAVWASVNLGIFVCMDCSGIHRKLGVHISSVKSPTLDTWKPEWVEMVTKVGNRIANDYYENSLPSNYPRPGQPGGHAEGVEDWIRRKYERKDFAPRSKGLVKPPPCQLVLEGKNPDAYSGSADPAPEQEVKAKSSTAAPAKTDNSLNLADMDAPRASAEQLEEAELLNTLTAYYSRVNEAKTRDQLLLIISKFKGRRDVLFAELEKKYGQPVVQRVAQPASQPAPQAPPQPQQGSEWSAFGAGGMQQQDGATQSFASSAAPAIDVPYPQPQQPIQPLDCLKQNLSALYEQSPIANAIGPAANGSNFDALRCMPGQQQQQQASPMQGMNGMNGAYGMNGCMPQQMGYNMQQQMLMQQQQMMMMQQQQNMMMMQQPAAAQGMMGQAGFNGPQF